jgi:hypothetical protein
MLDTRYPGRTAEKIIMGLPGQEVHCITAVSRSARRSQGGQDVVSYLLHAGYLVRAAE